MKYKILKSASYFTMAILILFASGCVKKNEVNIDFSKLQDHVILRSAGLANLKAANLRVDNTSKSPDSVQIYAELASVNASASPVSVKIGVDNTQIASYNTANKTKFQPFPDGSFKLVSNTITITPGNHYAYKYLILDQTKFDPTISYMLPVSITDGSGKALTTNQNTIFYNIIGNPIAGNYTQEWLRWNNATGTGSPNFDKTSSAVFSAVDPTTISVDSGTGVTYLLSFTNTNGVLSDFQISFDPASTAGITITSGPTIVVADPLNHKYQFTFSYTNSAGSPRVIIDKFL